MDTEMMRELDLSAKQEEAVTSQARAITVVASAGTGKTEVVARRLERLLTKENHEEFRVLALSYTVRAAEELKDRLANRLGDLHRRVDADTIHGFAHTALRRYGTRIGLPLEPEVLSRDEDRQEILFSWLKSEGYRLPDDPSSALRELDLDRARRITNRRVEIWKRVLAETGALDYQAMIDRGIELMETRSIRQIYTSQYSHIVIDEAQNMTESQYKLLTSLIGAPGSDHITAMLVGDERQSIVGFAGADHTLMARFEHQYEAKRIELDINYRSAAKIDRVSRSVAQAMGLPQEETVHQLLAQGEVTIKEYRSESDEGKGIASWIQEQLVPRYLRQCCCTG